MSQVAQDPADHLRHASRLLWPNLPVLLCGSLLVAGTWSLVRALPPQLGWVAVLGIGLVNLPAFAALLHGSEVLLADEHFGVADLFRQLARGFGPAVRVTVLPTLAVLLTLAAVDLWQLTGQTWMLASVGLGMATSLVALYTGVVALPYVVRTRSPLVQGWLVSCFIATRNPVPVIGVLAAVALGVWAAAYLSFALIVLIPGPLALVWAAAVATATERSQAHLAVRSSRLT